MNLFNKYDWLLLSMSKNKIRISIAIDTDLLEWIDNEIESNHTFANRSHAIQVAVHNERNKRKTDAMDGQKEWGCIRPKGFSSFLGVFLQIVVVIPAVVKNISGNLHIMFAERIVGE